MNKNFAEKQRLRERECLANQILRKEMVYPLLFAYVQGALEFNPNRPLMEIIRAYYDRFLTDTSYNIDSLQREYNRMKHEYLKDPRVFQ